MKVYISQINSHLGDFKFNSDLILNETLKAKKEKADLVIFPECALFGYYPADLLERPSIVEAQFKVFKKLITKIPKDIHILFGFIDKNQSKAGKLFLNSACLAKKNKIVKNFSKTLLPSYDIFDERRHFEPGDLKKNSFKFKGQKILVSICEDIWAWPKNNKSKYSHNPFLEIKEKIDLHINLSASPYTISKASQRKFVIEQTCKKIKAPMIYVNQVGAQDETIFDGSSLVANKEGKILHSLKSFSEDSFCFDLDILNKKNLKSKNLFYDQKKLNYENIHDALILGLSDFFKKTGFKKAHLGLSGGVDSALVYYLACKALGSENISAIALPTKFNASQSFQLAEQLCKNLNSELINFPIERIFQNFKTEIDKQFKIKKFGLVHENLQARIRADILMAFSNTNHSLLLATSNKTEMAVGYSTLYGDMCGGISPIGDLTKTQVYALCQYINRNELIIPKEIITRPPSAELRPNQKDQDSLPEYKLLDQSVSKLVQDGAAASNSVDLWTLKALMNSEFKRWQAPPVLKITDHAFGQGRRFPIAHKAIY